MQVYMNGDLVSEDDEPEVSHESYNTAWPNPGEAQTRHFVRLVFIGGVEVTISAKLWREVASNMMENGEEGPY